MALSAVARKRWTQAEVASLATDFATGKLESNEALSAWASSHDWSPDAVYGKLVELGLITPEDTSLRDIPSEKLIAELGRRVAEKPETLAKQVRAIIPSDYLKVPAA